MVRHIKQSSIGLALALSVIAVVMLGGCADGCSSGSSNGVAGPTGNAASAPVAPTNSASSPPFAPAEGERNKPSAAQEPAGPPTHDPSRSGPPLPEEARDVASRVVAQLAQPETIDPSLLAAPWVTKYGRVDNPALVLDAAKRAYRDGRRGATSAKIRGIKACQANRPIEEILATIGASKGRPGLEKMIEMGQSMPDAWIVWCDMAYTSGKSVIMDENILLVTRLTGGFKVHGVD